jgi:cell shape-determining protein MreC
VDQTLAQILSYIIQLEAEIAQLKKQNENLRHALDSRAESNGQPTQGETIKAHNDG